MFGLLQGQSLIVLGTRAALAAIALHLIMSFGHMHPLPSAIIGPHAGLLLPDHSDGPKNGPATNDRCEICANIAVFAGLDLPSPVMIALSASWVAVALPAASLWNAPSVPAHRFHSRAPPVTGNH